MSLYVCMFVKFCITAQPGPVTPILQCYNYGFAGVCVCVWFFLGWTAVVSAGAEGYGRRRPPIPRGAAFNGASGEDEVGGTPSDGGHQAEGG